MDFKVFLSNEALKDLEAVVAYIAPHNPGAAERYATCLIEAAESLSSFPERGRIVPEFGNPTLRELLFKSYRIVYRLNSHGMEVEVVRFWHAARGEPEVSEEDGVKS